MNTVHLLDVNLLLALCDPRHVHHEAAHRWFGSTGQHGWATCPITENGLVRIASQPRYPNSPGTPSVVFAMLKKFCQRPDHHFWPDEITLLDRKVLNSQVALSPNQITDVYLLALAVRNRGKLATFDRTIPALAVAGGQEALEVVPS